MNAAVTATIIQYAAGSRPSSARENGDFTVRTPGGRSGSRTPKTMTATETKAGITAIQNTALKSSASHAMNAIAASGPSTAPIVSSD